VASIGLASPPQARQGHLPQEDEVSKKFNGLDPKTNELVFADGKPRPPGIDPETREYSTAQMMFDEMCGGDTSEPLFD
jgi:hypothetical protein